VRAAIVSTLDGPHAIEIAEVAEPLPTPEQVLIDVEYAGVVFPDALKTRGEHHTRPELPFIPGSEIAGVVRTDAGHYRAGDRVAAYSGVGGFAETAAVDARMVFPLPASVRFDKGAALPMNYLTVHCALRRRAHLQEGETVMVQGGAGGIGTAACQLARAYGARVIAVVSTEEKAVVAKAAGAHEAALADGFLDQVRQLTDGRGVDVVVDPVGGDRFTDSLGALAPEGRLLVIGFTGRDIPTVKVNRLLLTNTTVMGVAWAAFWAEAGYVSHQWSELTPLLESGAIDPQLGPVFTLDRAADAVRELDERRAAGKVLIRMR